MASFSDCQCAFMPAISTTTNVMIASVAPIWDGNETWLVMGGIAMFTAFPTAFAIIFPGLYFPILAMLLGLVFRGVAFEFRWCDPGHRKYWDAGFFLGSLVATFVFIGAGILTVSAVSLLGGAE